MASNWRTITASKDGECRLCGGEVKAGETVRWHRSKGIEHERGNCVADLKPEFKESTEKRWASLDDQAKRAPVVAKDRPKTEALPSGERKMQSQFSGSKCRVCGKDIEKGAEIAWKKGPGARHIECEEGEKA